MRTGPSRPRTRRSSSSKPSRLHIRPHLPWLPVPYRPPRHLILSVRRANPRPGSSLLQPVSRGGQEEAAGRAWTCRQLSLHTQHLLPGAVSLLL